MGDSADEAEKRIRQYRRIARLPWGSRFLDEIQLLSPLTWRGAAILGKVQWEWETLIHSAAAALLIPLACYFMFDRKEERPATEFLRRYPGMTTGLYSIWSVAWLWKGTTGIRAAVQKAFLFSQWPGFILGQKSTRSPANVEAWRVLSERITQRRAYRTRRYDVYLPPSLEPARTLEAILFLPGFGAEHVAYAEPASGLADAGFVVVLLSAEPLRVASKELGFASFSKIKCIQHDVCKRLNVPLSWSVMGHSLGSFTATHLAMNLNIPRIVMWGAAPMDQLIADLSTTLNKRVMVIQGSNDKVIEFMVPDEKVRKKQTENFYRKLPKETSLKSIEGGNHNGFANYTPAFSIESPGMPRKEQHAQAVALTVDFLRKV